MLEDRQHFPDEDDDDDDRKTTLCVPVVRLSSFCKLHYTLSLIKYS